MTATWTAGGLYAIVDPDACGDRSPVEVAAASLSGGAGALQLRAKRLGSGEILALADALRALCKRHGVPFVLNDRVDLAALAGADAVHLGQRDLDVATARALAPELLIGVSTHDPDQANAAAAAGADYVAYGPVFATVSKENPEPVVGVASLAAVARGLAPRPVVAIGGIDASNVRAVRQANAAMAAVIGAVCRAVDPESAARRLSVTWQGSDV